MSDEAYLGGDAKFYRNAGSYGTPSWALVSNCGDADIADSRTAVDAPTRAGFPYIGYLPGRRDITLTWSMLNKKGSVDTHLAAMRTAYDSGNPIELAVADGDISTVGTNYRRIYFIITKCDEGQPLDGVDTLAFEAKPAVNNEGHSPLRATR